MVITSYNHHCEGSFLPSVFDPQNQSIPGRIQPSLLSNQHIQEVSTRRKDLVVRTMAAVKDRLTKEINYWDHRANQLKDQELAGKTNAKINSGKARQRADELQARMQKRMADLVLEGQLSPLPPVVVGVSLVIPIGLLRKLQPDWTAANDAEAAENRKKIELLAMKLVMEAETRLGYVPRDVSGDKCGYDIESRVPDIGKLPLLK